LNVKIFRGTYFFTRLVELDIININSLDKLQGTYPQKDIVRQNETEVEIIWELQRN